MSILGNRGGNAQERKPMPPAMPANVPAPAPAPRPPTAADPRSLHPAAIAIDELHSENVRLKAEVQRLTNELEVAQERREDAERALEFERSRVSESDRWRQTCQRYAVEIYKGVNDGMNLIEAALKKAAELAHKDEPMQRVEAAAKDAVAAALEGPPEEQ